jgi:nucleotidyltransferase/DNA polymerase involved in DNA repair
MSARLLAMFWPELRAPEADPALLAAFEPMLDRLDDLSPRVEAVDTGVVLVDITGLGALHGSERRIAARAVALTREVAPLTVRCGVGENRWLAALAARLARPERPDAPAAFRVLKKEELAALPLGLLPTDPATRQRFALFGLTGMGQLAALPRSAVGAQFEAAGERLQALARGEDPRPLHPRRRPERLQARVVFEPALDGIGAIALTLRREAAELCDQLRARHLAPGRAALALELEDAPELAVELAFPAPALEPDWIARLLIGRLESASRSRRMGEEPRVVTLRLILDRLGDPASRQLAAFEVQAGRWEELRWSLERLAARFGEGRLWRAVQDRPNASLAERRSRLVDIGPSAP